MIYLNHGATFISDDLVLGDNLIKKLIEQRNRTKMDSLGLDSLQQLRNLNLVKLLWRKVSTGLERIKDMVWFGEIEMSQLF